jgi:hypothetical protein
LLVVAAIAYYRLVYIPAHIALREMADVLPLSVEVMDTTAELRNVIGHLHAGDRVDVLARTAHWSEVRMPHGGTGWVESKNLLDDATYQRGEALLKGLEEYPRQAAGHTSAVTNLHLDPARDSTVLAELAASQPLEIFGRRLVDRPPDNKVPTAKTSHLHDVWYLVRANSRAGWVLGRLIDLDVPPEISPYAEGTNMVAWLVLRTVNDGAKTVPEYLVADRIGTEDIDFNHVRVFNWWVKNHKYVTAYVESNLTGYFPITAKQMSDPNFFAQRSPYFRLHLVGSDGRKFQKVYGLFDTIVRPLGTVEGWDSEALPERQARRHEPAHRRRVRR